MQKFALFREPFIYFVLIGALIYFIVNQKREKDADDIDQLITTEILVDSIVVNDLKKQYELLTGQKPTQENVESFVKNYVIDGLLYKEGLKAQLLNSDKTKSVIISQMKELKKSEAKIPFFSDAQLDSFYQKNIKLFFKNDFMFDNDTTYDVKYRIRNMFVKLEQDKYLKNYIDSIYVNYNNIKK